MQVGWWKKNEKEKSLFSFTADLKRDKLNNKVTKNNKSENSGNNKNDMNDNDNDNDTDDDEYQAVQPVFMDIWRKEYIQKYDNENTKQLNISQANQQKNVRTVLTSIDSHIPIWLTEQNRTEHDVKFYTTLYYTTLYYTILYYTILYCTILYYTILYYTILYLSIEENCCTLSYSIV